MILENGQIRCDKCGRKQAPEDAEIEYGWTPELCPRCNRDAAGRGEGEELLRFGESIATSSAKGRTGEWGQRHEIALEQPTDRKGQLTDMVARLTRMLHRDLVTRTNDGRDYHVIVETRAIVLVDPPQAQVGEYVSPLELERCLGKIIESPQAQGFFGDGVRYFQRDDRGLWRRVDVPQGYKEKTI